MRKNNNLLLMAGVGIVIYFLMKGKNSPVATALPGGGLTVAPGERTDFVPFGVSSTVPDYGPSQYLPLPVRPSGEITTSGVTPSSGSSAGVSADQIARNILLSCGVPGTV